MHGRLSLQARLILLVLAAILPLAFLSVFSALRDMRRSTEATQAQLKLMASLVAANQDRLIDSTRDLLTAISVMPVIRQGDRGTCQRYFEELQGKYPVYTNLGLLRPDGRVLCHASGALSDASAADRDYFRQAVALRTVVMGEVTTDRLSGRRGIPFALALTEGDVVTGVVFASMDVAHAAANLSKLPLPDGARVIVTDSRAMVLMEYPPRPEMPAGRTLVDPQARRGARDGISGTGEAPDAQGVQRVYAFAPSRAAGGERFLAAVSVERQQVAAASQQRLRDDLLVLALSLITGLLGATWVGQKGIVVPAKRILAAVRRLERGELDVRLPLPPQSQQGDLGRIAAAFNLLAESLQLRRRELDAELRRSLTAYSTLDLVLNSMQEALVAVTPVGTLLMFNEPAARLFPLHGPALLPRQWQTGWGLYHADGATPLSEEELPMVRAARGESASEGMLFVRNGQVPEGKLVQVSFKPIHGDGGIVAGLVVFTDVTLMQHLLKEQTAQMLQIQGIQRRLEDAQRVGRTGSWELDLGSRRLWWSDEVYELFGLERHGFDRTFEDFLRHVHPHDRGLLEAARNGAIADGSLMDIEYRVLTADGRTLWMHERGEVHKDGAGAGVAFAGVVQDISERKATESALKENERKLQEFALMLQRTAEAAQAITSGQTLEATMQRVVDEARAVIGVDQAVLSLTGGNDWSQVVTALSVTDEYAAYRSLSIMPDGTGIYSVVCATNQPLRLTQAAMEAHPKWRDFGPHKAQHPPIHGLLAVPLVDRSGRNIGLMMLSNKAGGDFTEHDEYVAVELAQLASIAIENARLFEQIRELNANLEDRIESRTAQLAQQEKLYRTLAQQAPEVVWNTDAAGERLTFLNRAWYELVGGTADDWLGRSGLGAIHPDDREAVSANWRKSRETKSNFTGVRRILARDGSYHTMSYKGAPVLDEHGQVTFWVGIDADITEYKAIERALRTSNEELQAFSYSVSHDLRAPLGVIGGFSSALAQRLDTKLDERSQHYLTRIQVGVAKMEQLIEALLSLAKVVRAPLELGTVDLSALARETLEGLRMQHPQRHVEARVEEGLVVTGDPRLLRLVMENLLGNAWKFSVHCAQAAIEVGRLPGGAIFVRDNGVGFDMAYVDKLFKAFQRLHADAEFPGTGIGLATVHRIVTRHGGRVWVESLPGRGTTFFFALQDAGGR